MKKLLFALAFLCAHSGAFAQTNSYWQNRIITTDYNSCLHGVKDTTGRWVIEPQYEYLVKAGHSFIVGNGGRYGLLDRDGKRRAPIMYDFISGFDTWYSSDVELDDYYIIHFNLKVGVIDSVNNIVVPAAYDQVRVSKDSVFLAAKGKHWEFWHLNGAHYAAPRKSKFGPNQVSSHLYSYRKRTLFRIRYGIHNDSGNIVIPAKYDAISVNQRSSTIRLLKNGKYGFCSTAGRQIWPMIFSAGKNERYNSTAYDHVMSKGVGQARIGDRWGLINLKGDTVLSFAYDHVRPFSYSSKNTLWVVELNEHFGIYDHQQNVWVMPAEYEKLNTVATYFADGDSSAVGLIMARRNDKWGAMLTSGQVIMPFNCDTMIFDGVGHYFLRNDSVYQLSMLRSPSRDEVAYNIVGERYLFGYKWTYGRDELSVPADKMFRTYRGKGGIIAYYHNAHTNGKLTYKEKDYALTGDHRGMLLPDSILFATAFYVRPVNTVIHEGKGFRTFLRTTSLKDTTYKREIPDIYLVRKGKSQQMGLLSYAELQNSSTYYMTTRGRDVLKSDGTIVINGDSVSKLNTRRHGKDGTVFFVITPSQKYNGTRLVDSSGHVIKEHVHYEIGDFNERFAWQRSGRKDTWELIDFTTGKNLLGKKVTSDRPFAIWDSMTICINEKTGYRLFNAAQKKYLTPYGFATIKSLNPEGTLFAVKTCLGNMGVMNASGKWMIDTLYTALTPVDDGQSLMLPHGDGTGRYLNEFHRYLVFHSNAGSVMFDTHTQTIVDRDTQTQIQCTQAFHAFRHADLEQVLNDSVSKHSLTSKIGFYLSEQDSLALLPWQKQCISDSLYAPKRNLREWHLAWSPYTCQYCRNAGAPSLSFQWTKNYDSKGHFFMLHRSDSLISFSRFTLSYADSVPSYYWCSNVMLFQDGAHQLSLDSLFNPQTDWRNFIINTVIGYVNTHLRVKGDCSNPVAIPLLLQNNFLITTEGLRLYPPGFTENRNQLVILVPWKDVNPYLRNDMRSRLLPSR